MHGVYLASKGLTCPEIMSVTSAARRTIQQWAHKYNEQGIAGLRDKPPVCRAPYTERIN
ncbi:MAG: helix-turn-helix domain-containing protein [Phycisphaerae bacterium]|nr:helix-turn-helix domain-containing protein [Phycisphaerae bacterium]